MIFCLLTATKTTSVSILRAGLTSEPWATSNSWKKGCQEKKFKRVHRSFLANMTKFDTVDQQHITYGDEHSDIRNLL